MKKILAVLLVLAAAGAGTFVYFQNRGASGAPADASESGVSSAVSSAASPAGSSEVPSSQPETSSVSGTSSAKDDAVRTIESAIDLDWKKYTLKESSNQDAFQGKTYRTFEIWYDDYQAGPKILLDPDDGKLYTRSYQDTAEKPVPLSEDAAFDKTVHTVTGTVTEDGAMMSFFIETSDGTVLPIPRYGIDTDFGGESVVGKQIRVYYTGVIRGDDMSRAFVTKAELVK
jgi:hypothetical protein